VELVAVLLVELVAVLLAAVSGVLVLNVLNKKKAPIKIKHVNKAISTIKEVLFRCFLLDVSARDSASVFGNLSPHS